MPLFSLSPVSILNKILDVAGAAALLLEADPSAFGSQAREMLEAMAVLNQVQNVGDGSPNSFLYIGDILGTNDNVPPSNPYPPPVAEPTSRYTTTVTMRLMYDDYPHETSVKFFRLDENGYTEQGSWNPPEYRGSGFSSEPADDWSLHLNCPVATSMPLNFTTVGVMEYVANMGRGLIPLQTKTRGKYFKQVETLSQRSRSTSKSSKL
jgi:hypothetical protein